MALPNQLKSARMTDSTLGKDIDDNVGYLEVALCDILGITIDTNVTESHFNLDNSGRITKALVRQAAAPPVGWRFRDTSNGKEFRLALSNTSILIDENTGTEGTPTWTNRLTIALGTGLPTLAAATDPSADNDLTRRAYVDGLDGANVKLTGNQTVAGIKTFSSFPVTPSSDPTTDYQAANKKYVDDNAGIPAGTKMLFYQASVPTGWTQDTSVNDKVLRVVSGSGGGSGGSWTISGLSTGATPIGTSYNFAYLGSGGTVLTSLSAGGSHSHTVAADGAWRPAYIDVIVGVKS